MAPPLGGSGTGSGADCNFQVACGLGVTSKLKSPQNSLRDSPARWWLQVFLSEYSSSDNIRRLIVQSVGCLLLLCHIQVLPVAIRMTLGRIRQLVNNLQSENSRLFVARLFKCCLHWKSRQLMSEVYDLNNLGLLDAFKCWLSKSDAYQIHTTMRGSPHHIPASSRVQAE